MTRSVRARPEPPAGSEPGGQGAAGGNGDPNGKQGDVGHDGQGGATAARGAATSPSEAGPTRPALKITTTKVGAATQGKSYQAKLAYSGGSGRPRWSVTGGKLPTGLKLGSGTGRISGEPTKAGTSTFTVTATEPPDSMQTASVALKLTVHGGGEAQPVATACSSIGRRREGPLSIRIVRLPTEVDGTVR